MKKILLAIKENKWVQYSIMIIVSLLVSIPLINLQLKSTHDGNIHLLRIMGMTRIFKMGEFPPFINPDYCNNWGYAINLFYGPLVTIGPYILKIITAHYYDALKLFAFLTIIASSFTMYHCTLEITGKKEIALLSAIFYTVVPYRLETIYKRFAIGEFTAILFMPLVFQGLYSLLNEDGKKHYLITIGAVGLILSHAITTEFTAIICAIYVLFNIKSLKNKEVIKKIFINLFFIVGITLFFTMPIIEYKILGDYTIFNPQLMRTTGTLVQKSTLTVWQFFVDAEADGISFKIGIPVILSIILGFLIYKRIDKKYINTYIIFYFFAILSLISTLYIIPWILFPDWLCTIQFSWRMLTFWDFFISIICAINLITLFENMEKKDILKQATHIFVCLILICILSIPYINRHKMTNLKDDYIYEDFITREPKITHLRINRDYLTSNALWKQKTYLLQRDDKVHVLQGNAIITNENKSEELSMTFYIENATKDTTLELPYLYYLGYEVKIENNGESNKIETYLTENGFVGIKIPEDIQNANVTVKYTGTILEKSGFIASFVFLVLFIIYLREQIKKEKGVNLENK